MTDMPAPNVVRVLVLLFLALSVGSVVRFLAVRQASSDRRQERFASLRTWWLLTLLLGGATLLGTAGVCLLMGAASWLAMRELIPLVSPQGLTRLSERWIFCVVAAQYLLIYVCGAGGSTTAGSLLLLLSLTLIQVLQGATDGFVRSTAGLTWGASLLVFGLSHTAMMTDAPAAAHPESGSVGWFLYLILLTETNDIAQALVGRQWGRSKRHRIAPRVSPNKTWEGWIGGVLATQCLALLLAPWLTTLTTLPPPGLTAPPWFAFWPSAAGLLVSTTGFLGDITWSAVKRDAGVKDSSQLLPGMGGMLDRVDSLTLSAPAMYVFLQWLSP